MEKFATMFPGRSNLTSVTPLNVVNLAANNNTGNFTGSFRDWTRSFSPCIITRVNLVLLGFFLFFCFFCICLRPLSTNWDDRRPHRNINEVARGLEPEIIESFPIFSYNLAKHPKALAKCSECAICLSDFADHDMVCLLTKCSHAFHPECIDKWLFKHKTCPVCRTRAHLVRWDEYIATATEPGLVEPQAPTDEVTVVIDNGTRVNPVIDTSNDEATNETSGYGSMAYSLVRARKEKEQPTE